MSPLFKQLAWFIAVGCAAAATHWAVAVTLVSQAGLAPPIANAAGWLIAFLVSFSGHYHLTFRHSGASWIRAAPRFFLISVLGFAVNETSYIWLLRVTSLPYDVLLAAILIAVAALTFLAGRLWAFHYGDNL
jgi:putative flippase GtrA